jgi:hypothetical protein
LGGTILGNFEERIGCKQGDVGMKNVMVLGLTLVLLATVGRARAAAFTVSESQALQASVDAAVASAEDVRGRLSDGATVALLPISGDRDGYVSGLLLNGLTAKGLTCVEAADSEFWEAIMAEVEWDERKADMLDPETLVTFGKLKGAKYLVYGSLRAVEGQGNPVYVELELHLSSIETKEHVWGGTFARRFYLPGQVQGITTLDDSIRKVLGEVVRKGSESVKRSTKLGQIKSVAILPLPGDLDAYVKARTVDMLSATALTPRELDLATLGEARVFLRDKPGQADALLYGAVRDLSRELKEDLPLSKTYEVRAEVQLFIQDVSSGDILWSDTLRASERVEETVSGKSTMWKLMKDNPRLLLYVGGGIIAFLLLLGFVRAKTRVR